MSEKFLGFYLHYMPMRERLEGLVLQFYRQLLSQLGMFTKAKLEVAIRGSGTEKVTLKEAHMVMRNPGIPLETRDGPTDLVMFRGDYMGAFQDGTVLYSLLKTLVGNTGAQSVNEMTAQLRRYEQEGKSSPHLRVFYWYLAKSFVTRLPLEHQIAFSVDCLLYGQWRVSHPNLIGLHLLMLAWMLGVKEFQPFLPSGMVSSPIVVEPPFASFLDAMQIRISLKDPSAMPQKPTTGSGQQEAKVKKQTAPTKVK